MSDNEANRVLLTTKIASMLAHATEQGVMALIEKANEISNNPESNHIFSRQKFQRLFKPR